MTHINSRAFSKIIQSIKKQYRFDLAKYADNLSPLNRAINDVRYLYLSVDFRSILAFSLPFVLYLVTLAPTVYNLDSAELTTAAYTGGIVRATGYPFYLALGNIWSKIPIGDVGFRMNLFSAFSGALTIMLADRIMRRWNVSSIAALGALGLLATGTYFWGLSLIAEVYTLHTALMAALILALLRWGDQPTSGRFAVIGLLIGLGLSHHLATLLLIPGSFFYIVTTNLRKAVRPLSIFSGLIGFAIGLGFYLYLPIRYFAEPAFNYAGVYDSNLNFNAVNLMTLDGLIWLVSGRVFSGQMFAYQGIALWNEILHFVRLLVQAFFAFGFIPGLIGVLAIFKKNWRLAGMLMLMFVLSAGFYIDYQVIDKDTMFLPAFLIWAFWLGYGYHVLFSWLKINIIDARIPRWGLIFTQGFVLFAAITSLIWNYRIADLSGDYTARERGERILEIAEENAIIFGWWDTVPVIEYLQLVEGKRTDVIAINRFLISYDDMTLAVDREIRNRPIYMDSVSEDIRSFAIPKSRGPIFEIISNH